MLKRKSLGYSEAVLLLLMTLVATTSAAAVIQCKNERGNPIFTDNASLCHGNTATAVKLKEAANPDKEKISFRIPQREYQKTSGRWSLYLESSMVTGDPDLADKAQRKLERNLSEIFAVLPAQTARKLERLSFYLMWGEDAPGGGRDSGMSFIRDGEPDNYPHLDPRWNGVIVIYSAKNLMYLDSLWTKKALMHELAHAWHIMNWPEKYEPIYAAYVNAKSKDLYRNVKDYKGKTIPTAYAIKNQLEYFAELSAIYFVGGNYFPYSKSDLKNYDSAGFEMVSLLW